MRKRISRRLLVLLVVLLTACGTPTDQTEDEAIENMIPAEFWKTENGGGTDALPNLLPELDANALKNAMPEKDYAAFEGFLPVLEGEKTFCWVAGPCDGYPDYNWEPFDAGMEDVRDRFWEGFEKEPLPEILTLDRLAVQDVDGDGSRELILLFQDGAYRYLILHMEEDGCYGTSFYIRWMMGLQTNGVYMGSGGAGSSTYYRMVFRNERFEQQELGSREEWATGGEYRLDGETVTKESFDRWQAEHLPGEVAWYAPDGSPIPEHP